jgi:nitrite reductase/ring-hydroxylating ferredoxin subunit
MGQKDELLMVSSNNIKENHFTKVANLKDFQEGSLMKVEIKGKSIVLAMVNGQIHAMNSVCSHQGGPLEEGTLEGYDITCPLHYAVFDIRNGKVSDSTVWATDLESYEVKQDNKTGDLFLKL